MAAAAAAAAETGNAGDAVEGACAEAPRHAI